MPLDVKTKKIYKQLFYIIYFVAINYIKNMKDTQDHSVSFALTPSDSHYSKKFWGNSNKKNLNTTQDSLF